MLKLKDPHVLFINIFILDKNNTNIIWHSVKQVVMIYNINGCLSHGKYQIWRTFIKIIVGKNKKHFYHFFLIIKNDQKMLIFTFIFGEYKDVTLFGYS